MHGGRWQPTLAAAAAIKDGEGPTQTKTALDHLTQEAEVCTRILTASKQ
jgi:hypothetical protein